MLSETIFYSSPGGSSRSYGGTMERTGPLDINIRRTRRWTSVPRQTDRDEDILENLLNQWYINETSASDVRGSRMFLIPGNALEKNWTDIVDARSLNRRQRDQQEAIWELITTEKHQLERLETMKNLWMGALKAVKSSPYKAFSSIDVNKIFSCIDKVYEAHLQLWQDCFGALLVQARSSAEPLNPGLLADRGKGFYKIDETFEPYLEYCSHYHNAFSYLKQLQNENEHLQIVLNWCENQPSSERLTLSSWIFLPVARVMRYELLLEAVRKKTDDNRHKSMLAAMIKRMKAFVRSVNRKRMEVEQQERLTKVHERISAYEVFGLQTEEIGEVLHSHKNLGFVIKPKPDNKLRFFLREARKVRIKSLDELVRRNEVHLLLFSDMLLICRQTRTGAVKKLRIIRPPVHLNTLRVQQLRDDSSWLGIVTDHNFGVASDGFVLSGDSSTKDDLREFLKDLQRAQEALTEGATLVHDPIENTLKYFSDADDFPIEDHVVDGLYVEDDFDHEDNENDPKNLPQVSESLPEVPELSPGLRKPSTDQSDSEHVVAAKPALQRLRSVSLAASLDKIPTSPAKSPSTLPEEDLHNVKTPLSTSPDQSMTKRLLSRFGFRKSTTDIVASVAEEVIPDSHEPVKATDSINLQRKKPVRRGALRNKFKSRTLEIPGTTPETEITATCYRRASFQEASAADKSDSPSDSSGNVSRNESIKRENEVQKRPLSWNSSSGVASLDSRPSTPETDMAESPSAELETIPSQEAAESFTMNLPDATEEESSSDQNSVMKTILMENTTEAANQNLLSGSRLDFSHTAVSDRDYILELSDCEETNL